MYPELSSIYRWDFPWNKPSSYWAPFMETSIAMDCHSLPSGSSGHSEVDTDMTATDCVWFCKIPFKWSKITVAVHWNVKMFKMSTLNGEKQQTFLNTTCKAARQIFQDQTCPLWNIDIFPFLGIWQRDSPASSAQQQKPQYFPPFPGMADMVRILEMWWDDVAISSCDETRLQVTVLFGWYHLQDDSTDI